MARTSALAAGLAAGLAAAAAAQAAATPGIAAAAVVVDVPAVRGALNHAIDQFTTARAGMRGGGGGGGGGGGWLDARATTLRLAEGRHELTAPLVLTAAHSGLSIVGAPGAKSVVSGGVAIDPAAWETVGAAACGGCGEVVRAALPAGTNYSRQFYVDGVRANWTSAMFPTAGASVTATGWVMSVGYR
jgi:hypothetical protein